jgi:hypothetical protein
MRTREKLLHPATFISLAALFVALGGVGYAATRIGTKQLKNRAVTAPKLANNSVTSPKIRAGAVGNSDLANNSVSTQKIQAGAIMSSDLAVGSVLGANLANGAVTSSKLAADSVLGANLANGAVTSSKLAAESVLGANLANGAVISSKLANGAVENHNLANGSVSSDKLGTGAVTAPKLAANSVTSPAIAPDSITAAQIQNGQVVEGNGTLSSASVHLTNGESNTPLLTFPGLGVLQADCVGGVTVELVNTSGATIDWANWGATSAGATVENGTAANDVIVSRSSVTEFLGLTWMASFGTGSGLHLATINTSTAPIVTGGCVVMAQATYTS